MDYSPSVGVFINGNVIDGPTIENEFSLVATQLTKNAMVASDATKKALEDSKTYTNSKFILLTIDGGTF